MCIIVAKPANEVVKESTFAECFRRNSDGAGFMYSTGNKLIVEKGFFKFDDFMEAYTKNEDKNVVAHFRIKTHGDVMKENCHPFLISPKLGFAHNGVIQKVTQYSSKEQSDTFVFNQKYLQPFISKYGKRMIGDEAFQGMVEAYIGNSKLAFLDSQGRITIYNKSFGESVGNVWFSNTSFKPVVVQPTYHGNNNYYGNTNHHGAPKKKVDYSKRSVWNRETQSWENPDEGTQQPLELLPRPGKLRHKDFEGRNQALSSVSVGSRAIYKQGDTVVMSKEYAHVKWQFGVGDMCEVVAFPLSMGFLWLRPLSVGGDSVPECVVPVDSIRLTTPKEEEDLTDYYLAETDFLQHAADEDDDVLYAIPDLIDEEDLDVFGSTAAALNNVIDEDDVEEEEFVEVINLADIHNPINTVH